MKVRVLTSCVGPHFTITEGEVVDLADEHCPSLIERGCVEPVDGRAAPCTSARGEVAAHEATPASRHAVKGKGTRAAP